MRAEPGTVLLWLLLVSTALQAAPADPADDLAFLEFLALMIEDEESWIDPLTARELLPPAEAPPVSQSATDPTTDPTTDPKIGQPPKEPVP